MAESRLLSAGELIIGAGASGPLLTLEEPVSFWGGVDEKTGRIIDYHHPQYNRGLAGAALLMGATRGSSSSSSMLLECIRRDTAPALFLLTDRDTILVVAVAVAWEIYRRGPSVVVIPERVHALDGEIVHVDPEGRLYATTVPTGR